MRTLLWLIVSLVLTGCEPLGAPPEPALNEAGELELSRDQLSTQLAEASATGALAVGQHYFLGVHGVAFVVPGLPGEVVPADKPFKVIAIAGTGDYVRPEDERFNIEAYAYAAAFNRVMLEQSPSSP